MSLLLPSLRIATSTATATRCALFSPLLRLAAATTGSTVRVKSTRALEFPPGTTTTAAVGAAAQQEDHPWKITCHFSNRKNDDNPIHNKSAAAATSNWDASMIPTYLQETYWWAYLHPIALKVFERQWLVNSILWGNYRHLRDEAQHEVGICRIEMHKNQTRIDEKAASTSASSTANANNNVNNNKGLNVLRVACVYGDFDEHLLHEHLTADDQLHIIDVAPQQLENTLTKLSRHVQVQVSAVADPTTSTSTSSNNSQTRKVHLWQQDSSALTSFDRDSMDVVLVFFLLHEMPLAVRQKTIQEAIRVLTPDKGRLVIVDYHAIASRWNPLYYIMQAVLSTLEPFALDLWRTPLQSWLKPSLPDGSDNKQVDVRVLEHKFYAGGLYQKLVVQKDYNILATTTAAAAR